jgi:dTDP-glucose 4,6-dehydratase
MSRRAIVAGGSGFIGSHLCEALLSRGFEVLAVDNFITGARANTCHLVGRAGFELLEMNAEDALTLEGPFDLVLHFASPASPPRYMAHPIETLHSGSSVTEALLRLAQRENARFILSSTSEVYGDPLEHPQRETYWGNVNSIGPRSVYDEAKRYAEAITMAFRRSFSVNTGIVRIFNTYGPRMDPADGRAVPAFIGAALDGRPLPIHGDGTQTRSLCFVDDLVEGVISLALTTEPGPINIGNPREQTLLEIAEEIVRISGSSSTIEFHPRPTDDPERRQPDITLARTLLDWTPRVQAGDGLTRTIEWFAGNR